MIVTLLCVKPGMSCKLLAVQTYQNCLLSFRWKCLKLIRRWKFLLLRREQDIDLSVTNARPLSSPFRFGTIKWIRVHTSTAIRADPCVRPCQLPWSNRLRRWIDQNQSLEKSFLGELLYECPVCKAHQTVPTSRNLLRLAFAARCRSSCWYLNVIVQEVNSKAALTGRKRPQVVAILQQCRAGFPACRFSGHPTRIFLCRIVRSHNGRLEAAQTGRQDACPTDHPFPECVSPD